MNIRYSAIQWNGAQIAIQPMGVNSDEITTTHEVSVTGLAENDINLHATPIAKKTPYALWGNPELAMDTVFQAGSGQRYVAKPQLNGERFVGDALVGYEIRWGQRPQAGMTHPIPKAALTSEIEPAALRAFWTTTAMDAPMGKAAWDAAANSQRLVRNAARDNIFKALGLEQTEVDFGEPIADSVQV